MKKMPGTVTLISLVGEFIKVVILWNQISVTEILEAKCVIKK